MRTQKGTYQVINTKFRQDGIWWERKTTYERDKRIGVVETLALTDNDKSVTREKPDFEKCVLCREAKRHTVDLHEEMVEAWHSVQDGRQVEYVDDSDRMEWEILNAEAENRQVNWDVIKGYSKNQIDAMWQGDPVMGEAW